MPQTRDPVQFWHESVRVYGLYRRLGSCLHGGRIEYHFYLPLCLSEQVWRQSCKEGRGGKTWNILLKMQDNYVVLILRVHNPMFENSENCASHHRLSLNFHRFVIYSVHVGSHIVRTGLWQESILSVCFKLGENSFKTSTRWASVELLKPDFNIWHIFFFWRSPYPREMSIFNHSWNIPCYNLK